MAARPVVLVHGYSDKGESFETWKQILVSKGFQPIEICSYESLVNEVTVKDIAEGFERALRMQPSLRGGEPFDAIVHSTGMLVVRSWLTTYGERRDRIKHLIGLAPATFGSPLAHKGRSWLGAIFKGRKELGPDFLEAGDLVLDALELGSRFTWDLAHLDLIGEQPVYGRSAATPYVHIFCGNRGYRGLAGLIDGPGTDGTVRWAGCPLNTRKFVLDLTRGAGSPDRDERAVVAAWSNVDIPLQLIDGLDHSSIVHKPSSVLVDLVVSALQVSTGPEYDAWLTGAAQATKAARESTEEWQQFVVHAVDERGDPIQDFNLQLMTGDDKRIKAFDVDVHSYRADASFRSFHVNLSKLKPSTVKSLKLRLIASSGTRYVTYYGVGSERYPVDDGTLSGDGKWDAVLDLSATIGEDSIFYPFTTTLIELRLNREPFPMTGYNKLTWFLPRRDND